MHAGSSSPPKPNKQRPPEDEQEEPREGADEGEGTGLGPGLLPLATHVPLGAFSLPTATSTTMLARLECSRENIL